MNKAKKWILRKDSGKTDEDKKKEGKKYRIRNEKEAQLQIKQRFKRN